MKYKHPRLGFYLRSQNPLSMTLNITHGRLKNVISQTNNDKPLMFIDFDFQI